MRLIQVARKLQITQNEVIEFLHDQGIQTKRASNTKLEEDHVKLVYQHFNPEFLVKDEQKEEITSEEEPAPESVVPEATAEKLAEDQTQTEPQIDQEDEIDQGLNVIKQEEIEEKEIEVIRPQLIKLEGVKLVGKIDLPEPPIKKPKEEEGPIKTEDMEQVPKSDEQSSRSVGKNKIRGRRQKREVRTPLTYEEKVKREEERKLRKQHSTLKKEKKKKFDHYYKNVQSKLPSEKPTKKLKKKEITASITPEKQITKNPFKRFWSWLNGEFDQF